MVRGEEEAVELAGLAEKKKHAGRRKEAAPSGLPGRGKEAAGSGSGRRSVFFKFLLKRQNGPFTKIAGAGTSSISQKEKA